MIELLVVTSIIAVLASMLLVLIPVIREMASRTACASLLRQHGLAILTLANDLSEGKLPSMSYVATVNNNSPVFLSRTNVRENCLSEELLTPYLGLDTQSSTLARPMICPSNPGRKDISAWTSVDHYFSTYAYYGGAKDLENAVVGGAGSFCGITPEPTKVLLADALYFWAAGPTWVFNHGKVKSENSVASPPSGPTATTGMNLCFGDGHVSWQKITPTLTGTMSPTEWSWVVMYNTDWACVPTLVR